jgi:hypothetical protein
VLRFRSWGIDGCCRFRFGFRCFFCLLYGFWAAAAMFEKEEDFLLHGIDLVEREIGIADDEDVAELAVLIDAKDAAGGALGVGFAEDFFPLQHHGEDVAGVFGVVFVFLDKAAEEILGALFFEGVWLFIERGDLVGSPPEGEGRLGIVGAAGLPCFEGEVLAEVAGGFWIGEEGGDDCFATGESLYD